MSLIDALFLDPVRINIWIAKRPDNSQGSGTQQDPYSGNTQSLFDAVMRDKVGPNTCVHLGPGIFETAGYYEGISGSWELKPGMRIVGSGMDVTILKRVNNANQAKQFYAIGHSLTVTSPTVQPNLVDGVEICELTIDCNFAGLANASAAAGAIRMMGNNSRVVRVKAIRWGAKSASVPGFVMLLLTGNTNSGNASSDVAAVNNTGIQECLVTDPDSGSTARITALHVGAKESPGTTPAAGVGPYIRNCFVDGGGISTPGSALGMSWCRGGVIESNYVQNIYCGGPAHGLDSSSSTAERAAQDMTLRNNVFRNVCVGVYSDVSANGFGSLRVLGNWYEFSIQGSPPSLAAVRLLDKGETPPSPPPPYGKLEFSENRLIHFEGNPSGPALGLAIQGVSEVISRQNIVDLGSPMALSLARCPNVSFLENRSSAGVLVQGWDTVKTLHYSELATQAQDALMYSLINTR